LKLSKTESLVNVIFSLPDGIDLEERDEEGRTILHRLLDGTEAASLLLRQFLRQPDVKIGSSDAQGNTLLHRAAQQLSHITDAYEFRRFRILQAYETLCAVLNRSTESDLHLKNASGEVPGNIVLGHMANMLLTAGPLMRLGSLQRDLLACGCSKRGL